MEDWKHVIDDFKTIIKIQKLVAEYEFSDIEKIPYLNFKIKIYQNMDDSFEGITNILIRELYNTKCDSFSCVCGIGDSEMNALQATLKRMYEELNQKEHWSEDDFRSMDIYDF